MDFISFFFKGLYHFFSKRAFRNFVFLFVGLFLGNKNRAGSKSINGKKIDFVNYQSFLWQYYEIYYSEFYKFKTKTDSPIIVDCGSNIGMSVLYYKQAYPNSQITGFEPSKKIFQCLKKNVGDYDDVILHEKAVWISDDFLFFNDEGSDSGKIMTNFAPSQKLKVEAIDLNNILSNFPIIDFLKIDIEGAEKVLIPHIKPHLNKVQNIFIEHHSFINQPQNLTKIISVLEECGFRYYIKTDSSNRLMPLINRGRNKNMDMQLNIFGFRI